MRDLGIAHYHPYADAARIGHNDGASEENADDAVMLGTDESEVQHVADGCKIMRRTVGSEDVEEGILRVWVDNAVREFEVGKKPELAIAAKAHLEVILARRKASGEKNAIFRYLYLFQRASTHHTYNFLIDICSLALADQPYLGQRASP